MLTVKVAEVPDVDGLIVRIQDLQDRIDAAESEVDEIKDEAGNLAASVVEVLEDEDAEAGDLGDTVAHYQVKNIDRFFTVYEFQDEEEDMIREEFEDHDLLVYRDGAAIWSDGRILVAPSEEMLSDEDFEFEAGWVGEGIL